MAKKNQQVELTEKPFLCRHFVGVQRETSQLIYTFYGGNVVCVPVALVASSISDFLTAAIKFSCFSCNKIVSFIFLSLDLTLSLLSTSV